MADITSDKLTTEFESKFMNVFEYPFGESGHYYTASRRKRDDLVMLKSDTEYKTMYPDAVTIAAVLRSEDGSPRLLLNYEFRYAAGRYLLAPPAGLIDEEDKEGESALIATAVREMREETGIIVQPSDRVFVVNPLLFSSPGMTDESNAIVCVVIEHPDFSQISHDSSVGAEEFNGFELVTIDEAKKLIREGVDKKGYFYSVYTYLCLMYFVSGMWE